jgi:hypothetical protein
MDQFSGDGPREPGAELCGELVACFSPFFTRLKEETVVSRDEVAGCTAKTFKGGVCDDVAFWDLDFVADSGAEGQTC